jgi:hypothetical protein
MRGLFYGLLAVIGLSASAIARLAKTAVGEFLLVLDPLRQQQEHN